MPINLGNKLIRSEHQVFIGQAVRWPLIAPILWSAHGQAPPSSAGCTQTWPTARPEACQNMWWSYPMPHRKGRRQVHLVLHKPSRCCCSCSATCFQHSLCGPPTGCEEMRVPSVIPRPPKASGGHTPDKATHEVASPHRSPTSCGSWIKPTAPCPHFPTFCRGTRISSWRALARPTPQCPNTPMPCRCMAARCI